MTYLVAPREEWRQIFADAWRWYRDFFYDKDMHGRDWKATRAKYAPWVEEIRTRQQLNWLLSEMVGELSVSHTYIGGGDMGQARPRGTHRRPGPARGRPRGRRGGRALPLRARLRPDPVLHRDRDAPGTARRGRQGGRLPPRHQRAGRAAAGELLPPPAGGQERRGDAHGGPRPEGPGAAHLPREAGEVRPRRPLRPLGHRQRREGGEALERRRRLHARHGHGRPGRHAVRQVLAGLPLQEGPRHRRARQRRRVDRVLHDRQARAAAGGVQRASRAWSPTATRTPPRARSSCSCRTRTTARTARPSSSTSRRASSGRWSGSRRGAASSASSTASARSTTGPSSSRTTRSTGRTASGSSRTTAPSRTSCRTTTPRR